MGSILALLSGLRIQHCCELWCRLQTRLRYGIAVAVAGSCSWKLYLCSHLQPGNLNMLWVQLLKSKKKKKSVKMLNYDKTYLFQYSL